MTRQDTIVSMIEATGFETVSSLAEALDVNVSTIRRDLEHLAEAGLVRRTHGGAIPIPQDEDTEEFLQDSPNRAEKRAIGPAMAERILDGGDGGRHLRVNRLLDRAAAEGPLDRVDRLLRRGFDEVRPQRPVQGPRHRRVHGGHHGLVPLPHLGGGIPDPPHPGRGESGVGCVRRVTLLFHSRNRKSWVISNRDHHSLGGHIYHNDHQASASNRRTISLRTANRHSFVRGYELQSVLDRFAYEHAISVWFD